MGDIGEKVDHIAGLRKFANHLRENEARPIFAAGLETHTDALAAERDALRAYAKFLEDTGPRKTVGRISDERAEHGVADLMDADR